MKWRLTHKEYTLMLGILVAVVVVVVFWFRPLFVLVNEEVSEKPAQGIVQPAVKLLLERTLVFATQSINK
jgi:hypothetical protein